MGPLSTTAGVSEYRSA